MPASRSRTTLVLFAATVKPPCTVTETSALGSAYGLVQVELCPQKMLHHFFVKIKIFQHRASLAVHLSIALTANLQLRHYRYCSASTFYSSVVSVDKRANASVQILFRCCYCSGIHTQERDSPRRRETRSLRRFDAKSPLSTLHRHWEVPRSHK
jgi:hypothetical protein